MTKQTAGYDGPPVIAGCDRQSHKSNRHPNLSASHPRPVQQSSTTYPSVIPDLIGDLRTFGLAPGAIRSPQNACSDNPATQGLPEHAD